MAHVRPRGKGWQAVVTLPTGRQVTRSDRLKSVVQAWARETEAELRRDRWHDPRPGRALTLAQWREEWMSRRMVEPITVVKDASHWKLRIAPQWGEHRLTTLTRASLQQWVKSMVDEGTGAHTVSGTVGHLGAMLQGAVEHSPPLLMVNPARGLTLPRTSAGRLRWFTREETSAILAELDEPYRTLVDLGCHSGLRWGELAGLDAAALDLPRRQLHVRQVLSRAGLRPYGKSTKSHRDVPIPDHLLKPLGDLASVGIVFSAKAGRPLVESNFRQRVYTPALSAAGVPYAPPHTMRHTAASWLVQAGVPLYEVQRLMGHESYRTTERYAHLAPDAHDAVRAAWASHQATPGDMVQASGKVATHH